MADLSNLIYIAALSSPQQPGSAAAPEAQRPRMPRQAGSAGRLAPLLAIRALSLLPLGMSTFVSHVPATHEPHPNPVYSNAPREVGGVSAQRSCPARCTLDLVRSRFRAL